MLRALDALDIGEKRGWQHHPVTLAFKDHRLTLAAFGWWCWMEWFRRGYDSHRAAKEEFVTFHVWYAMQDRTLRKGEHHPNITREYYPLPPGFCSLPDHMTMFRKLHEKSPEKYPWTMWTNTTEDYY